MQQLQAFPLKELLTACVPLSRQKRGRGYAALYEPVVRIPAMKPWVGPIMDYAKTGEAVVAGVPMRGIYIQSKQPSRPVPGNLGSIAVGGSSKIMGVWTTGELSMEHTAYTHALMSGNWAPLVDGWEAKIPTTLLPKFSMEGNYAAITWDTPIGLRTDGWFKHLASVQLKKLLINEQGGKPVFAGIKRWMVEPQLRWDTAPAVMGAMGAYGGRRTRQQRALDAYLGDCAKNHITPTRDGAERYIRRDIYKAGGILLWLRLAWAVYQLLDWYFGGFGEQQEN